VLALALVGALVTSSLPALPGNLASATDDLGTATFGYDELNRLVSAAYPGSQNYAYTYDSVGNVSAQVTPGGTTNHTFDAANQIADAGYLYDANGSLVYDGTTAYTYDALNRLSAVTSSSITATYSLDGEGNRIAETFAGQTTTFSLDLRGLSSVLESNGRLYLDGMPSAGYDQAGAWTGSLVDQAGSVIRSVAPDGTLSASIRYDPYGAPRAGSATPAGFGYAGEWTDPAGLLNLRARAYDPASARFTSADSYPGELANPLSANPYAYGLDNPLAYTDPSGHIGRAINFAVNNADLIVLLIPGFGAAYGLACAVAGRDLITGRSLSTPERLLYAIPFAGAAGGAAARFTGRALAVAGRAVGAGMSLPPHSGPAALLC
jgi:RHS repeat-associated protein